MSQVFMSMSACARMHRALYTYGYTAVVLGRATEASLFPCPCPRVLQLPWFSGAFPGLALRGAAYIYPLPARPLPNHRQITSQPGHL